ncbi:hypothetical protein [Sandaracinus amylolyticus]|uniref:hypothetical protein n=1 Tax=Sandaracinus amylolyticus TaxID=927083 RepID=UPI001F391AD3|nr:hypothetical protein [Sandaracinus amylolyticus]UJR83164.1 Hypothetical protein I5071_52300 [Sandaracinus amylolyticus]
MRSLCSLLVLVLLGCGDDPSSSTDAGVDAQASDAAVSIDAFVAPPDAADIDAGSDAGEEPTDAGVDAGSVDAATCPTTLLVGGADIASQGWTTAMGDPATLTYGADHVQLETTTASGGARTSGHLLLTRAGAVVPGEPYRLEIEMRIDSVTPHNQGDSAAAILGSFTPLFGIPAERAQMIYVDANAVGWADDSASSPLAITNGEYHTYVLAVDASGAAELSIDGAPVLTRAGYTTNGTIAIGDQTNDPNVDSTLRIRSVRLLCP